MYHPEIFDFDDMYLSGYFACEKYYGDILYDLREKLQFPPSGNPLNEEAAGEMRECQFGKPAYNAGGIIWMRSIKNVRWHLQRGVL